MNKPGQFLVGWLALFWLPCVGFAEDTVPYREGTHYQRLLTPAPTSTGDKIEVVEVFWYGCSHCYHLEPTVETWLAHKPEKVEFMRVPAVFGRNWEPHARAFYTAQVLGVLPKIHKPLYDAIHASKRPLSNEAQLAEFFAEQGVDKELFVKTYQSFDVETRLRRSQQLVQKYGIDGVPAVIVNGKYLTNGSLAGSPSKIFEIVDYLLSKESKSS
jgi:thiol:disulfide interchange protein DsbA